MVFIVVICSLVVVAGVAVALHKRRVTDPVIRQARALAALRNIAEHQRPPVPAAVDEPIEHVHLLHDALPAAEPSSAQQPRRRTPRARKIATALRPNVQSVAPRPTIAELPTLAATIATPTPRGVSHPRTGSTSEAAREAPLSESRSRRAATNADASAVPPIADGDHNARRVEPTGASSVRDRVLAISVAVAVVLAVVAIAGFAKTATQPSPHTLAPPLERHAVPPKSPRVAVAAPRAAAPRPRYLPVVAGAPGGDGTVTIGAPFTVAFVARGNCWIRVRTPSGQVLFEGTLHAGQRQQITGSGPVVVRIGNTPVLSLDVNGTPLDLSRIAHTANIQFLTS